MSTKGSRSRAATEGRPHGRATTIRAGVVVATVALGGALAAPAGAATVQVDTGFSSVVLEAAAGEVNAVQVVAIPGGFRVRDTGAPLSAGPGCAPVDAATVTCATDVNEVVVRLGDGNDVAALDLPATAITTVEGGDGDDAISSGASDDVLVGGAGDDTIAAGAGDDFVAGDIPIPGTSVAGTDALDGGTGNDTVTYGGTRTAMRIDLAAGTAVGTGQADTLKGFENVNGSPKDDVIRGDNRANRLYGDDGDDDLRGRGGKDVLDGGSGELRADGGSGNDAISGFLVGRVRCGSGRDLVDVTAVSGQRPTARSVRSPGVEVGRDCERLTIGPAFDDRSSLGQFDPRARVLRGARVRIRAYSLVRRSKAQTVSVALRERTGRHRILATGRLRIPKGSGMARATVTLRPTKAGRRVLRAGRSRKVALYAGTTFWAPTTITVR